MAHNWNNVPEIQMLDGWTYFAYNQDRQYEVRPELKVINNHEWGFDGKTHPRIWKVFTSKANHTCVMGYPVYLQKGIKYRYSCKVWAWSSTHDNPRESRGGHYYTRVGLVSNPQHEILNPAFEYDYDEIDFFSNHEKPGVESVDHWQEHELEFVAKDSWGMILLECRTKWGVKHNDSYWDAESFSLEALSEPSPPSPVPEELEKRVAANEAAISKLYHLKRQMAKLLRS